MIRLTSAWALPKLAKPFLATALSGSKSETSPTNTQRAPFPERRKAHLIPCDRHNHRPQTYSPQDFSNEFGAVDTALRADSKVAVVDHKMLGPSLSGIWKPDEMWAVNFIPDHQQSLQAVSMSFYPANNCARLFGGPNAANAVDPQQIFPSYLDHTAGKKIAANYLSSTALAQTFGLSLVMLETNTASCGGFPGTFWCSY
jgi:hypothetical protein